MEEMDLPTGVVNGFTRVQNALDSLESKLKNVLYVPKNDLMTNLSPLQRAQYYLNLSKAANSLYCLYIATEGLSHADHPISKELERTVLYTEKVQRAIDKSKNLFQPTARLDVKAINRFIDHAIPDLSKEQKNKIREIGNMHPSNKRKKVAEENVTKNSKEKKESLKTFSIQSQSSEIVKKFLTEAKNEILSNLNNLRKNDENNEDMMKNAHGVDDDDDDDEEKNAKIGKHGNEDGDGNDDDNGDGNVMTDDNHLKNGLKKSKKTKRRKKKKSIVKRI